MVFSLIGRARNLHFTHKLPFNSVLRDTWYVRYQAFGHRPCHRCSEGGALLHRCTQRFSNLKIVRTIPAVFGVTVPATAMVRRAPSYLS